MNRLAVRLALVLLALSLLPLGGIGLVTLRLIERSVSDQVAANQRTLAEVSRGSLRLYLDTARGKLRTIAAILDEQGAGKGAKFSAERLNSLLEPPDIFVELGLYRAGSELSNLGQARAPRQYGGQTATPPQEQAYQAKQQQDYQDQQELNRPHQTFSNGMNDSWNSVLTNKHPLVSLAREGKDVFAPALKEEAGVTFLPMAVPVGQKSDLVLTAGLDLAPVWGQLRAIAGDREIRLTDHVGNILLNTRAADPLDGGVVEIELPAGHADWVFHVREPRAQAFANLDQARVHAFAWFGGAALLSVVLSFMLAAFILRPVHALTQTADRLRGGDLSARSNITRDDELGQLAASFDRMAAALQVLDQAKTDFVAHVSHELRTPLTSMKLSVANLMDGVVGPVEAPQQEVLGRVRGDLDRLIHMVNETLDIAKLEAGKTTLALEPVDLASIAATAAETLRPIATRGGVALEVKAAPAPMSGDRSKLHEIVVNLVDNAIKFTPPGGRVEVRVGPGLLEVKDSGRGIPGAQVARIFDKFSSVNADRGIAGAGLGLSITKKLVELHRGTIAVESAEGRGSTFTVRF